MSERPTLHAIPGGREDEPLVLAAPDGFRLTDVGNAERLVHRHGADLRYVHGWHRWLVWDGRRWALDETGEAVRRSVETVRAIATFANDLDGDDRKRMMQHALGSERDARLRAALSLAESIDGVPVLHDDLDADPFLLNVLNGTVDLRTGELRSHDRGDLISKLAPVAYDPAARAPRFEAFLNRILPDAELRAFVLALLGYSLTGETGEQILAMLYGSGANGKTTLLELIRDLLGDYGQQAPAETFLERRDTIPNDVARLRGARFVAATETGEGRRLNEVLVKRMTGGDTMTARFLRAEFFEFRPRFKVWLATNHKPEIRGTDEAIWRRIRLVPFAVTIPEEERDPHLGANLRDELPGVLALAVQACLNWQAHGLPTAAAVSAATSEYRTESDALGRFVDDACVLHPDAKAKATDLYSRFAYWCQANGEHALSKQAFGRRLSEHGFTQARTNALGRHWLGVGIRHDEGHDA